VQFPLEPFEIISVPTTTENGIEGVFKKGRYNQNVMATAIKECVVVCGVWTEGQP
jgi:hypothetical protein